MEAHVLNGDSLAYKFPIEGEVIVMRECLIEGPLTANGADEFWNARAIYISNIYNENPRFYFEKVKEEFEKLLLLKSETAINLWFEHDLFCQVNMWFVINYLIENKIEVSLFRVMPPSEGERLWSGFGPIKPEDLHHCYEKRIKFSKKDIDLGVDLWRAYQAEDLKKLNQLSKTRSPVFPLLDEVCEAHIERSAENGSGRPQKKLREIISSGKTDFHDIFNEFWKTEGVYGFGDLQIKNMLAEL